MPNIRRATLLVVRLSTALPAHSQTASPLPIDGDTLEFGTKQLVRLYGIDAPERAQTCDDGRWPAGGGARDGDYPSINTLCPMYLL